jgi:cytochrome c biogenesis protein CcdA
VAVAEVVYPQASDLKQAGSEQPLSVYQREFLVGARLNVAASATPGEITVVGRFRYQACDEKVCYLPLSESLQWKLRVVPAGTAIAATNAEAFKAIRFGSGDSPLVPPAPSPGGGTRVGVDRVTTPSVGAGYLGTDDFLKFIRGAETGATEKGWFDGRGTAAVLVIVLLGGLALNFTPCVLPMIPINLAIIGAGAQAGSRKRGFLLGATYGGAMALVYGVLGLIVILTAGTFGTINASPWFNAGIALLFIALALAMFDLVNIDFSRFLDRFHVGEANRGSFVVAFGMGGVAALLAGACVAPVVIQVVVFSSNLCEGTGAALAAAVSAWRRHGDPVADRGRRHRRPAEAGRLDGAREAGVRRVHPWHGGLLRLPRVRAVLGALGGCGRRPVERDREAQGRLVRRSRAGAGSGGARTQAGPDRPLGDLVQELPADGPGDPEGFEGFGSARRLREDQIPGGAADEPPASAMQRYGAIGLPTYVVSPCALRDAPLPFWGTPRDTISPPLHSALGSRQNAFSDRFQRCKMESGRFHEARASVETSKQTARMFGSRDRDALAAAA